MQTENILELRPVGTDSKECLDTFFNARNALNSEFTFTNMFMWQPSYNISYAVSDGMLFITSKHGDDPQSALFPLGDGDLTSAVRKILRFFEKCGSTPIIRVYGDRDIARLESVFPNTFEFSEDIDSSDYVYKTEDLIQLTGKKYHSKRNHINRFQELYNWEYHTMTPDFRHECAEMFDRWCDSKADSIPNIDEQRCAVGRLLDNWEILSIVGGCITVDGKMAAFSFGEPLGDGSRAAVIHLEHADTEFEGSFPMINQQFLKHEWSNFELVNREEDMGLEGLRRAKRSYKPCLMTKKFIARLK